ncbi:cytochrome d ubiquinol oxidase subunit II [Nonomuraea sp. NPDC050556]|uniref:cytochrome d ubiquinol oxidase subunit II n=1 Tax=Nonomuraea sp. NPDC050556 TaxID=3364369 RepID=UPI0037ADF684
MLTFWLVLLGLLLAGYFVLGGYDYGAQMLHPFLGRNAAIEAIGPFFLGNEVWLVAFAGVLFGAFPHLEGALLPGFYPLIVAILVGVVLGSTAVQLRRRTREHRVWDALIVVGGALPALSWGLVLGLLLRGAPVTETFTPFVLLCGMTTLLLFAAHGAAFVALRSAPPLASRLGAILASTAGATAFAALLLTLFGTGASMTNPTTAAVISVLFATALALARHYLSRGNHGRAFAATSGATLLPVLLVGAGHYPYVLVSSPGVRLTVHEAAADGVTLQILTVFGIILVPVILAYQAWSWWAFRGRTGARHPTYF